MRPHFLFLSFAMLATPVSAQQSMPMDHAGHGEHMMHGQHQAEAPMGRVFEHEHNGHMMGQVDGSGPREPGQSAFAAIQEIVNLLMADPDTDWDQVNIDALRGHLVDMDNVTLHADVKAEAIEGGARFTVTSPNPSVAGSITRMISAHAGTMDGVTGWRMTAIPLDTGTEMEFTGDAGDKAKIRALGFFGVMSFGMHHQGHHLALATGHNPHRH
ncbi:hypothetical protein [Thalassovita aquimarina]|uniref:Uncharacterized protein n=1 Tax=Thalassovita aquimarina TaxID=2785917 RepID=A0ABS5HN85_9RHOB|nr:hypothetical protein [Thalassovita aquimarina]MBR9650038.1 hypothetical protein [Thalassovita aquimarina]